MDYTLDPMGNWTAYVTKTVGTIDLNQTRTQNTVNEITAIGGTPGWATPPAYDPAGNMTSMPQVVSPASTFTATYDAWNRMTSLSNISGTVATYQYDGLNRRTIKITIATSETRHFYWTNDWQEIEERVGISTTMDRQYVWGLRYVDELVCRDDASVTPARRLYATQDANFNLTAITNASGNIAERYLFDPYGNRTILSTSWTVLSATAFAWVAGHQGLMHDPESGIVYNRYRYLHVQLGNFPSRDWIGYEASVNLYSYLYENPATRVDPSGLASPLPDDLFNTIGKIKTHGLAGCKLDDCCPVLYVKIAAWYASLLARTAKNLYYLSIGEYVNHAQADSDTDNAIKNCQTALVHQNCFNGPPSPPPIPMPQPFPKPTPQPVAPKYRWYLDPVTGKRVLVIGGIVLTGWAAYVAATAIVAAMVAASPVGA